VIILASIFDSLVTVLTVLALWGFVMWTMIRFFRGGPFGGD